MRIGQIELKDRWDISEDEEEERRRPGPSNLLFTKKLFRKERKRKGMIGKRYQDKGETEIVMSIVALTGLDSQSLSTHKTGPIEGIDLPLAGMSL